VVHEADALEFDYGALAGERRGRLRIVGNLPYNISTPLLFRLLASATAIENMHLMLQREVVDRMSSRSPAAGLRAAHRHAGALGAHRAAVRRRAGRISACARVWSAMVRMTVRPTPAFVVSPLSPLSSRPPSAIAERPWRNA